MSDKETTIINFKHGLGDTVQFRSALPQLPFKAKVRVDATKAWLFGDLAVTGAREEKDLNFPWAEPAVSDKINTKIETCLRSYGVTPAIQCYPKIVGDRQTTNVALIHYQGNSNTRAKNISHHSIHNMLPKLRELGYEPIIIDLESRSLLNTNKIRSKEFYETSKLWRLINDAALFIGIDSGPGHLAACTNTPSIIVWKLHHPLNYYCPLADNVVHLIPQTARVTDDLIQYYNYAVYKTVEKDLFNVLPQFCGVI